MRSIFDLQCLFNFALTTSNDTQPSFLNDNACVHHDSQALLAFGKMEHNTDDLWDLDEENILHSQDDKCNTTMMLQNDDYDHQHVVDETAVAPIDRGYDYQTSPVDNNMLLISSDDLIDTVNFDNDDCLLFGDLENGDNATVLPEVYDSGAEMRLRSLLCENDSGLHAHCV